jgi:hypothetical protein
MTPRTRSTKFVRCLIDAATVRPMLTSLLAMKRARVRGETLGTLGTAVAPALLPSVVEVAPKKAA